MTTLPRNKIHPPISDLNPNGRNWGLCITPHSRGRADRGEHRQAAAGASPDFERHPQAAKFSECDEEGIVSRSLDWSRLLPHPWWSPRSRRGRTTHGADAGRLRIPARVTARRIHAQPDSPESICELAEVASAPAVVVAAVLRRSHIRSLTRRDNARRFRKAP